MKYSERHRQTDKNIDKERQIEQEANSKQKTDIGRQRNRQIAGQKDKDRLDSQKESQTEKDKKKV